MKNLSTMCALLLVLLITVLGCSKIAIPGNVNMFEGDNAAVAAARIKDKIGTDNIKVIRAEVRKNSMKITIQAPNDPKNMDEYTFEKGSASGPKPVQVVSMGNLDMTADKYHLTDLGEINFGAIPETVKKAIALSGLEGAQVDLISMDQQNAEMTHPNLKEEKKQEADDLQKQIKAKQDECFKQPKFPEQCIAELLVLQKKQANSRTGIGITKWDLAWRLFVESPRGRKDYWSDKQGNIIEKPY